MQSDMFVYLHPTTQGPNRRPCRFVPTIFFTMHGCNKDFSNTSCNKYFRFRGILRWFDFSLKASFKEIMLSPNGNALKTRCTRLRSCQLSTPFHLPDLYKDKVAKLTRCCLLISNTPDLVLRTSQVQYPYADI